MALMPVTWPSMFTRNSLGCSNNSSRQSGHNGPVLVPGTGRYLVSHHEQNRSVGSAAVFVRRCIGIDDHMPTAGLGSSARVSFRLLLLNCEAKRWAEFSRFMSTLLKRMLTEVCLNERFGRALDVLRLGPCTGVLLRTLNNSYPLFKLRLYHFPSVRTVIISCFW